MDFTLTGKGVCRLTQALAKRVAAQDRTEISFCGATAGGRGKRSVQDLVLVDEHSSAWSLIGSG